MQAQWVFFPQTPESTQVIKRYDMTRSYTPIVCSAAFLKLN
jgi:hypothetical protein